MATQYYRRINGSVTVFEGVAVWLGDEYLSLGDFSHWSQDLVRIEDADGQEVFSQKRARRL